MDQSIKKQVQEKNKTECFHNHYCPILDMEEYDATMRVMERNNDAPNVRNMGVKLTYAELSCWIDELMTPRRPVSKMKTKT